MGNIVLIVLVSLNLWNVAANAALMVRDARTDRTWAIVHAVICAVSALVVACALVIRPV